MQQSDAILSSLKHEASVGFALGGQTPSMGGALAAGSVEACCFDGAASGGTA